MFLNLAFFVLVLPASVVSYALVPQRMRWLVLLAFSLLCFYHTSKRLIGFLFASVLSIYLCGLWLASLIERRNNAVKQTKKGRREIKAAYKRRMRWVVALGTMVNLGMLVACKYLGFFASLLVPAAVGPSAAKQLAVPHIGMPLGISFYTFMAISYLVDVYREAIPAERSIGRLTLFLSFFPQVLEGPICRYGQTSQDLAKGKPVSRESLYLGTLRILFGLAKKLIVADRLNPFVEKVFTNYALYDGGIVALGAIAYTVQLYCDFSGTIDVALGIGRIFDVCLPENFRQPFFSRTASEFWQRWHITLGSWFKDYVYYPVSLSKPCKKLTSAARKRFGLRYGPLLASSVALLCVWVGNGLWHGAGSQYLFFGLYYFVIITLGGLVEPLAQTLCDRWHIIREAMPYRLMQSVRTLGVVFTGELFFRAEGLAAGLAMFGTIAHRFSLESLTAEQVFAMGIDAHDLGIVLVVLAVLLAVGVLKERGCDLGALLASRGALVRWASLILLLMSIVVFGAYGADYTPVDPMYAQF